VVLGQGCAQTQERCSKIGGFPEKKNEEIQQTRGGLGKKAFPLPGAALPLSRRHLNSKDEMGIKFKKKKNKKKKNNANIHDAQPQTEWWAKGSRIWTQKKLLLGKVKR